MNISQIIKTTRDRMNLTQDQFATLLSTNRANIANYETGRVTPPTNIIKAIKKINRKYSFLNKLKNLFK